MKREAIDNTLSTQENCVISPPKFATTDFYVEGIAPLVIERFSKKAELMAKMAEGKSAGNKKVRDARDYDKEAEAARYRSNEGWEGMNAAAFRCAMISACRLVGFKMTLAKLSTFIEADGYDEQDGIPLVRVYGESKTYTAHTRNATGDVSGVGLQTAYSLRHGSVQNCRCVEPCEPMRLASWYWGRATR